VYTQLPALYEDSPVMIKLADGMGESFQFSVFGVQKIANLNTEG
jgi:hypothetical protein